MHVRLADVGDEHYIKSMWKEFSLVSFIISSGNFKSVFSRSLMVGISFFIVFHQIRNFIIRLAA